MGFGIEPEVEFVLRVVEAQVIRHFLFEQIQLVRGQFGIVDSSHPKAVVADTFVALARRSVEISKVQPL